MPGKSRPLTTPTDKNPPHLGPLGKQWTALFYGTAFVSSLAQIVTISSSVPSPVFNLEPAAIEKFRLNEKLANVTWENPNLPLRFQNKADLPVSDTSSLGFDSAFIYEKPVITLESPKPPGLV